MTRTRGGSFGCLTSPVAPRAEGDLSAPEALQLAAALVWCRERTRGVAFVCLDERLRGAATLEGFKVLPYADEIHEPDPDAG